MISTRPVVAGMLAAPLVVGAAWGLETDQYYAWGRELRDSTGVLNAKLNLEIERAAEKVDGRRGDSVASCGDVARQLHNQLHFSTIQDFEVWVVNSSLVSRAPADDDEEPIYRSTNLYNARGPLDVGMWLPIMPTIEVAGVRFGTDKLAHFVSSGWRWHRAYRRAVDGGMPPAEAEARTIRTGVMHERTGLGGWSTGVVSLGDLEANYQGMRFYDSLCHGADPILALADGRWQVRRPFDIATAVGPEWDESYLPPIYSDSRWRKVEPVLKSYCNRLDEPGERVRRIFYRSIDTMTAVEAVVAPLIEQGKLEDPRRFSIDSVCEEPPAARSPPPASVPDKRPDSSVDELMTQIRDLETAVESRPVGLLGLHLARPERVSGSAGVLFAQVPKLSTCRYLCTYSGALVQLGAGWSGGRLSAGWAKVSGERKGNGFFLSDPLVGIAFKGTVMRTWHDPIDTEPDRWYLGAEVEGSIARVNMRLGLLYRLEHHDESSPWLISAGIGWGF